MDETYRLGYLSELIDFRNGKAVTPSGGDVPIFGGNGVLGYGSDANYGACVIVGRVGAYCGSIHLERTRCWVSDNALAGVPKGDSCNEYNYYLLKALKLNERQIGSSQPLLTQGILNLVQANIEFDTQKQQRISAVLSALDAKIDLNHRINTELEALAKTIYDYWFVQFDFPDAHGRPYKSSGGAMVWNDILKREIPTGWASGVLSDIANITMGQSPAGSSYNEEGRGVVFFQGSTDFGTRSPEVRMYTTSPGRMSREGDILMSVRAPVGTLNVADQECCIGRGLAALNSKTGFDGYLYRVMANFKQVFDRRSSEGTTFGSITKDDLFGLKVLIPDVHVLQAHADMANDWIQMAALRDRENRELTQLRDWLLPLLMNGQVRVA